MDVTDTPKKDFFHGRDVFITGGTGFLGRVLIWKLLQIDDIGRIFLLIRNKRGQGLKDRLRTLFAATEIFNKDFSEEYLEQKIIGISGDISLADLGLSPTDRKILQKSVSVVFHSAATVKFDEDLRLAIQMNVRGTKAMLDLASQMPNLVAFVHVSTAYTQCILAESETIREDFYPVRCQPSAVIDQSERDTADWEPDCAEKMVYPYPNTYTFTKALGEALIADYEPKLPIAIIRPSIVIAALNEPIKGWIDNMNGPTGLFAGCGSGLLRSLLVDRTKIADLVPVDIVINLMCAAAAETGLSSLTPPEKYKIYNCTSGSKNPITWGDLESEGRQLIQTYPVEKMLWYPDGEFRTNVLWHSIIAFFLHTIPSVIVDFFCLVLGQKPWMIRTHAKIDKAVTAIGYFANRQWTWCNANLADLQSAMTDGDREFFYTDIGQISWPEYLKQYYLGTRKFVMKLDPSSIPRMQKRVSYFYALHMAVKCLAIALALYIGLSLVQYVFMDYENIYHSISSNGDRLVKTIQWHLSPPTRMKQIVSDVNLEATFRQVQ